MQISTNDAQWAFLKPLSAMSFSPQYHSQSFHVNVELRAGLKLLIAVFLLHEMKVIKPLFGFFFLSPDKGCDCKSHYTLIL